MAMRHDMRRGLDYVRSYHSRLSQVQLEGEGTIIAGTDVALSDDVIGFLMSLPNTQRGLAMRSSKLKTHDAKKALRPTVKAQRQRESTNAMAEHFGRDVEQPDAEINMAWFERLPAGPWSECYVEIEEEWLSEQRTKEITGLNFEQLVHTGAAPPNMLYIVAEADLEESDTAVHFAKTGSIFLNRNVPRNMTEKTRDWRYFPADDEDGFVPDWELQGYDEPPQGNGHGKSEPDPRMKVIKF